MRLPARLLRREAKAHKGDFGRVFILAGCAKFSGAALLCSAAAIRSGAGLVTLGIPSGLTKAIIKKKLPEIILEPLAQTSQYSLSIRAYAGILRVLEKSDILVIGPGLSGQKATQGLVRKLIKAVDKPALIDADGINALCGKPDLLLRHHKRRQIILTPHPGEMSRLLGRDIAIIQSHRRKIAVEFAKKHKVVLVLKGHNTIVADYQGHLYINKTGNPGMATAGTGDVLSGIIAAFMAQGLGGFEAAKYGVYLHGLAADLAVKTKTQLGLIASDIIDNIPKAIKLSS